VSATSAPPTTAIITK